MPLYTWSQTAASNGTADSTINWQEGQAPSTVNNSGRGMMAAIAQYRDDIAGAIVTAGTSTAYTVSSFSGYTSLSQLSGQQIAFVPHTTNTGTCTLNIDSLGNIPLHLAPGVELPSGTIVQGTPYRVTYFQTAGELILQGGFTNPYAVPLGGMLEYTASSAPNSAFILPYGQAISRTVYAAYFALVGTTYGAGDGSTTFNVIDYRGRYGACPDNMGGSAAGRLTAITSTIGNAGGAQAATIAQANLPAVNFTGGALSVSASGSYSGTTGNENQSHNHNYSGETGGMDANNPHSHPVSGGTIGGTTSYGNFGNFDGLTAPSGASGITINATDINHGHPYSGTTATENQAHNHNYSGSVTVSGSTATQSVSSGGSGTALTILPPTILVPRILRII